MENEIKRTGLTLRRLYAYYWFLALLLLAYGESGPDFITFLRHHIAHIENQ